MSIDQMRKNYELAGLHKKDIDPDPLVQFERWFQEAQQPDLPDWMEVNAMTLATSDLTGHVTARIVLLKGIEQGKLVFFTNYNSVKGRQIAANPNVALCFLWPHLQRQVRIEGSASKTDRARSEQYFQSRPRGSQLGAWVGEQSAEVANREILESRMRTLMQEYGDGPIPCPEHWGGYEVLPKRFEFWQGRPDRVHDRIAYQRSDDHWVIQRLAP